MRNPARAGLNEPLELVEQFLHPRQARRVGLVEQPQRALQ